MFQLIAVLLAVALMGTMAMATVSYLNPVAVQAQSQGKRIERGFRDLKEGFEVYRDSHPTLPANLNQITPSVVFVPPARPGTAWGLGVGTSGGRYLCLYGDFAPAETMAILNLRQAFSPQAYFVSSSCGATANAAPTDPTHWTGAVTLWVTPYT